MTNSDLIQIIGLIIQFAGFISVIIIFIVQIKINTRVSKREIYQRLEFASIDLFRFELENSIYSWRLYDQNYQIPLENSKEYHEIENHLTQLLNIFEMIIEFRNEKIVDSKIFASWIAWFWEISQLKNFAIIWRGAKYHYTVDLQFILNSGIASDGDWNTYIKTINKKYKCNHISKLILEDKIENKTNSTISGITFSWGTHANIEGINELVNIFISNIDNNYISHGEVIVGRAINLKEWKANLFEIIKKELITALTNENNENEYNKLALCELDNRFIGIAIIEFNRITNVSILSDIVIDNKLRGYNIGGSFISWIEKELKSQNIGMIFLESGIRNSLAHDFFEKVGYRKSSIVMAKEIK